MRTISKETAMPTVIIVGGGISGLITAIAVSKHVEKVTIIERDKLTEGRLERKGTPQGKHIHAFLRGGLDCMERIAPGTLDAMERSGAKAVDLTDDHLWFQYGHYAPRYKSGVISYSQTRKNVENILLEKAKRIPTIHIENETVVEELLYDKGTNSIIGIKTKKADSGTRKTHSADILVDASGRGSRFPRYIEENTGIELKKETSTKIDVEYASRIYEAYEAEDIDFKGLIVYQSPPDIKKGGVLHTMKDGA
uniref:FAD dependent oxidoreductase n=1 Tax=Candidatus Kentrum sp. LPFa TaxID=2126335 RepID=A0A450W1T3_9GAMM|nr:MAG: FAD dependent oxidoreductase [Candidatus Kentron sp. LPFa]